VEDVFPAAAAGLETVEVVSKQVTEMVKWISKPGRKSLIIIIIILI
jgi:hypothetical protein